MSYTPYKDYLGNPLYLEVSFTEMCYNFEKSLFDLLSQNGIAVETV